MTWYALLFAPNGWGLLLLKGASITIALALTTVPFGFGGGLLLAVLRMTPFRSIRAICDGYTTFFRGIPDLLALFIVYFGLQALVDKLSHTFGLTGGINVNAFTAGVVALAAVTAAYSSEVWIASLNSVPPGQAEAARSLGLNRKQVFFLVTLPQLGRVALPGLGNIWTILLKDTSLVSTLAVADLLRVASEASRATTRPLVFYGAATGIYLVFGILSNVVQGYLERRSNAGYR
jgi:polar amino acid transport system permease protein